MTPRGSITPLERNRRMLAEYLEGGISEKKLGEKYGLSQQGVSDILRRMMNFDADDRESTRAEIRALVQSLIEVHSRYALRKPPPAFHKTDILVDENGEIVRDTRATVAHTTTITSLLDRLSKLLGLDAPQKIESDAEIRVVVEGVNVDDV